MNLKRFLRETFPPMLLVTLFPASAGIGTIIGLLNGHTTGYGVLGAVVAIVICAALMIGCKLLMSWGLSGVGDDPLAGVNYSAEEHTLTVGDKTYNLTGFDE